MTLKQKAIKGVFWTSVQKWGASLLTVAVVAVLAHMLEPEDFGLVALALIFVGAAQVFQHLGVGPAIVQREELEASHLDSAFWANMICSIALAALAVALAEPIAAVMDQPRLAEVIRWLSVTFPLAGLSTAQQAIFERDMEFRTLAVRRLLATVAGGATGIGMAIGGMGVMSLVGQQIASAAVGALVLWIGSRWRPGRRVTVRHMRELASFGLPVMGLDSLYFLNRRLDHLVIGSFLGSAALGFYTIGNQAMRSASEVLSQSFSPVALPTFSRLNREPGQMCEAFCTAVQMTSVLALPAFTGLIILAPEFITVVFGSKWAASIPVMRIMCILGLLHPVALFSRPLLLAAGKPRWVLAVALVNSALNVLLLGLVVAMGWGIVAVAAAFTARACLMQPVPLILLRRLVGLDLSRPFRIQAAPAVATAVMAGVVGLARWLVLPAADPVTRLALCVVLGAATYALAIMVVSPALCRRTVELVRLALPGQARTP